MTISIFLEPNIENFTEKFNKQSKLGSGPQHREFHREIQQAKQVGVRASGRVATNSN